MLHLHVTNNFYLMLELITINYNVTRIEQNQTIFKVVHVFNMVFHQRFSAIQGLLFHFYD